MVGTMLYGYKDRTEVLISTDRCTMGTTLERDRSALDIYKLIIRSLPRATSRQWQTPRKFQTRWRSPPRDAERKEEISAQKCGKIDTKWHMNDEHGASKRNSVLLVLLTKKQMVPIHKNEIIEKSKITK